MAAVINPRIVVTGASTGIGLALVRRLIGAGYRVAATARRTSLSRFEPAGLKEGGDLLIRPLDVTNGSEREALIDELNERWGGIDVLVNNAALSYRSAVEEMSEEEDRLQMETNYIAPLALTRLVLPKMRAARRGKIINISSVGGMMAMPTMGPYSASKFALEGASEALWYELKPWGVSVSLIQPGFVHSNAFRHVYLSSKAEGELARGGPYRVYYEQMAAFIARLMERARATPDSIARQIVDCIEAPHPPLRIPATLDASVFSLLRRFLPRHLYHWALYRGLPGIRRWGSYED